MAYINRSQFFARYHEVDRSDSEVALQSVLATCEPSEVQQGPLQDVALLVKDNIEAIGLPGSAGSLALMPFPATRDAQLVTRLRRAGADIVGAANLSEWANFRSSESTSGWSAVGGLTGNPWILDRSAGGSSSGSGAAVAAGLVSVAIGSETDGSIVCPAAFNGVVGLKPTVGTVPVHGVVPISETQDVPGPIAIDVALAAQTYEVISERTGMVEAVQNATDIARTLRIGVAKTFLTQHHKTDSVFAHALTALESHVAKIADANVAEMTDELHGDEYTILATEIREDMARYLHDRLGDNDLNSLEAIVEFNRANAEHELQHFGQDIFEYAITTQGRASKEYQDARKRSSSWAEKECLGPALAEFDLLVSPAYGPAWKSDLTQSVKVSGGAVTSPSALLGWPLLCVPMGLVDGLPVGFTIIGRPQDEARMLALGEVAMKAFGTRASDGFRPEFRRPQRG
ncbi:MAG: hypothetical protein RIS43_53 [Actinomycetota bacterium]|jgi:amidase